MYAKVDKNKKGTLPLEEGATAVMETYDVPPIRMSAAEAETEPGAAGGAEGEGAVSDEGDDSLNRETIQQYGSYEMVDNPIYSGLDKL